MNFAYNRGNVYLYSGESDDNDLELYVYNLKTFTWAQVHVVGERPKKRSYAGIFIKQSYLYLLSGWEINTGEISTDFFYIDLASEEKQWQLIPRHDDSTIPQSTSIIDVEGSQYIFGGWRFKGPSNALFKIDSSQDGRSLEIVKVCLDFHTPAARVHSSVAYSGGKIYMFGGQGSSGNL